MYVVIKHLQGRLGGCLGGSAYGRVGWFNFFWHRYRIVCQQVQLSTSMHELPYHNVVEGADAVKLLAKVSSLVPCMLLHRHEHTAREWKCQTVSIVLRYREWNLHLIEGGLMQAV
jgi:hypothetical protein